MKKLSVLGLLLFLFLCPRAQRFSVSYSEELKFDESAKDLKPVFDGFMSTELILDKGMSLHPRKAEDLKFGLRLAKYDHSRNLQKQATLSNGDKIYGPLQPSFFVLQGQAYLLYNQFAANENKMRIMLAKIDTASLEIGQPKELVVVDSDRGIFNSMKFYFNNTLILSASPDSSKLLAVWTSGIEKDNDYFVGVYDHNLDKAWNKKQTIPFTTSPPVFQSACTDNGGNVVLGYKVDGDKTTYEGRITLIRRDAKSIDSDIRFNDGHTATILLLPAKDGSHILIMGTYSDKPRYVTGVYIQQLNIQDGKIKPLKQTPFPDDLVQQFHRDGWAETRQKIYGLNPIALQPFQEEDGSIDMIGAFNSSDQLGPLQHPVAVSITGDILYIHLGVTGAPLFGRVPKYRRSAENTIGDSYYPFLFNNRLVILYNDSQSNLSQDINAIPTYSDRYNNLVLVAATFLADGQPKREKIIDLTSDSYLAVTGEIQPLSPSSILIPLRKIKGLGGLSDKFKWGTLEIK
jgi:hypothetical protein